MLPQGFTTKGVEVCLKIVAERGVFIGRDRAEEDTSQKQIIPYAVVTFREEVFLFRRTSRGGEARLHQRLSIGVGGHINREGVPPSRLVEVGLRRELEEELSFDGEIRYRAIGIINDDREPVGQVHLGIVYQVNPASRGVRVREEEVLEGGFTPIMNIQSQLDRMESWSRLVAKALFFS